MKVLITGDSSGIGRELKKIFLQKGDEVIGLSRTSGCDVTDEKSLDAAFEKIDKIDILINCAGFGLSGAVELTQEEQVRKLFDVNFFGLVSVTKRALPLMSENGKIINISSTCALFPLPFRAYYCASKAAVNMITDGLRMELKNTKIQVSSVCPGEIKTNFTKNRVKNFATNDRYGSSVENSAKFIDEHENRRMSAEKAAKKIAKFIEKRRLKPQIIIGKQKILFFFQKILPKSWMIKLTQKLFVK